ncbi:LCP family protein [Amycolatopsis sp. cg5]|uniref:LCP family protein n=1 Tax=Amycolatopsis sp. cg5 TaxID=3238802 RepID=UPI003526A8E5
MLVTHRVWRRSALGLVALAVLGGTGYAWAQLSKLDTGITVADIIPPSAQLPPGVSPSSVDQNILLVGIDSRTDAQGNPLPQDLLDRLHAGSTEDGGDTTDSIIVVHLPAGGGAATAISIPRDSYVPIAGGLGSHKINSAFSRGKNAAKNQLRAQGLSGAELEKQSSAAGARSTVETVQQVTGLTINHYAAVNLAGFYSLSEAIGGVNVCLNNPVNDKWTGANFPAGEQSLSGADALAFVRQRHGLPSDLDRIKRQQAFLSGMAKKILSAGTLSDPTKLSNLISAVQGSLVIDKGWDIFSFAQQLRGLSAGAIEFNTVPVQALSMATPSDGDAVKVDLNEIRAFVKQVTGKSPNGNASTGTGTDSSTSVGRVKNTAQTTTSTEQPVTSNATGCVN